ncbi:alpha/beta fold hydrolase [Paenibacillus arenilitoris]|uniref:Alpha/beta hydrolase n=1 Tax=Paenibacillus arenilitoris TaxID=2772299 RepID=A0A927CQJ9_9BACL|nr:alpha/beta hydrolase [Paenibacillus arenilitoris]MBD2872368.1 alpha/beta hydrolase [Paenibacillus arenilitoris]
MSREESNIQSIAQRRLFVNNGVQLAYYDSHPEDGGAADGIESTVVLLHGYCGCSSYWEPVLDELERSVRVIAPDVRGHGLSSAPEDDFYTMELYSEDVASMLIQLQIHNAVLLGHSLGGYITLALAEKYDKKLSGFGLIHSTPLPDGDAARQNRDKAVAALQADGVEAFVRGLVPKLFAEEHLDSMKDEVERAIRIGIGTSLQGAIGTAKGMKARPDRSHVIERSTLPVLLVAGEKDRLISKESTFAAGNGATERVELGGAGHMGMIERPKEMAETILRFVKKVRG